MPTSGLVFYAKLVDVAETQAETGQAVTKQGSISTYTSNAVKNGIPCIQSTNSSTSNFWQYEDTGLPSGNSARTTSIWVQGTNLCTNKVDANGWNLFKYGSQSAIQNTWYRLYPYMIDKAYISYKWYSTWPASDTLLKDSWHNIVSTFDGTTLKLYCDGVMVATVAATFNTTIGSGSCLNVFGDNWDNYFTGYMTAFRIYDRVITAQERDLLASEFTPHYTITANDLNFSLYQKSETYGISYSSAMPVTFEIIEGSLPSTISFNTSTGQFTGKGLTDADHIYTLKVRLTAKNSDPAECTVTIHTYMTARISLSNQTFNFISNKAENFAISYTSDETVTFAIDSGTMPAGMTLSGNRFYSNGQNTSAENKQVVIRATSAHNQTGVTATMTLNMQMNAIVCNAQTFKFYTEQGVASKAIVYSGSLNAVTDASFSMTGTLPTGVTFDSSTGTFTSDGTQSADETASVSVTISSSNGTSTAATANITLEVHEGAEPIPDDIVFYMPMTTISDYNSAGASVSVTKYGSSEIFTVEDGMNAAHFTSTSDYLKIVKAGTSSWPENWNSGSNPLSVSLWLKIAGYNGTPISMGTNGNGRAVTCRLLSTNTGIDTYNTGINSNIISGSLESSILTIGGWHHVYLSIYNNESNRLQGEVYIDGNFCYQGYGSTTKNTSTNNAPQINGCNFQSVWNNAINGYISSLRVYNRVLTDAEITALASEFTPQA